MFVSLHPLASGNCCRLPTQRHLVLVGQILRLCASARVVLLGITELSRSRAKRPAQAKGLPHQAG